MIKMAPEEAVQRRNNLIHAGYMEENPQRRSFETIANLTWEYGEQHDVIPGGLGKITWGVDPEEVLQLPGYGDHIHLVRRLISQPEGVKE